jgi:hypothetical protein
MYAKIEVVLQSEYFQYFISFLGVVYLWFMVIAPLLQGWESAFVTWKNWQTLNAAVIAFIATLLIIHSTRISEQKKAIKRRHSAKAFMSGALAEMCTYVEDLIKLLDDIHQGKQDLEMTLKPKISESALKRIEKFIEESSNQDQMLVEHLVIVINSIQVFDSRITSYLVTTVISNKKDRAFYQINQCTLLHALISGMFDFTRDITNTYDTNHLNSERFKIDECPLYMTDPEIEKYKKSKIEFKLFVTN